MREATFEAQTGGHSDDHSRVLTIERRGHPSCSGGTNSDDITEPYCCCFDRGPAGTNGRLEVSRNDIARREIRPSADGH